MNGMKAKSAKALVDRIKRDEAKLAMMLAGSGYTVEQVKASGFFGDIFKGIRKAGRDVFKEVKNDAKGLYKEAKGIVKGTAGRIYKDVVLPTVGDARGLAKKAVSDTIDIGKQGASDVLDVAKSTANKSVDAGLATAKEAFFAANPELLAGKALNSELGGGRRGVKRAKGRGKILSSAYYANPNNPDFVRIRLMPGGGVSFGL